ncbi:hypothetical protein BDR26DRAFT_939430 [Obelidium mucronatum]|nr:hypothetical protein BDR26DRAFT_939430 [Obelidium mucronatum]
MAPIPKKSLPKRLSALDPALVPLVNRLAVVEASELPSLLPVFLAPMPKSDLHHWIPALNRFDVLLESYLAENHAALIHRPPPPASTATATTTTSATAAAPSSTPANLNVSKEAVVAILDMTRVLWDNCTSRTLYASFEHVMALLYSRDLDIVNSSLLFLIRPPQRQSKPKAAKLALAVAHDRLIVLASRWGSKEDSLDLGSVVKQLKEELTVPEDAEGVFSFQFYWSNSEAATTNSSISISTAPNTPLAAAPSTPALAASADHSELSLASTATTPRAVPAEPSTPAPKSFKASSAFSTPATSGAPYTTGTPSVSFAPTVGEKKEGLVSIHVPNVYQSGLSEEEFVDWVVREYSVPHEHLFAVVHRARCAYSRKSRTAREKLVQMRVLALCVAASLLPEDVCQSKFFLYEPELPQVLADIAGAPIGLGIDFSLQAAAMYCSGIYFPTKIKDDGSFECCWSVCESWYHVLIDFEITDQVSIRLILLKLSLAFCKQLVNSSMGGAMLVSSGIVQVIIKAFQVSRETQMKNVSRFVTFLDLMIYTFPNAFTAFTAANGVDVLVTRIKSEVAACIAAKSQDQACATLNDVSFVQVALVRSLLKYVMHMMQISGMADQLRNLIETSLPGVFYLFLKTVISLAPTYSD